MHFQAVAGTSVGALNVFIWSTGRVEQARELWKTLCFKDVFDPGKPLLVALLYCGFLAFSHAYDRFTRGQPPLPITNRGANRALRVIFYELNCGPLLVMFLAGIVAFTRDRDWGGVVAFALGLLLPTQLFFIKVFTDKYDEFVGRVYVVFSGLCLWVLASGVYWIGLFWPSFRSTSGFGLVTPLFVIRSLGIASKFYGLYTLWALLLLTFKLASRFGAFSARPLRKHIAQFTEYDCTIPTYATTAVLGEVFDPDSPVFVLVSENLHRFVGHEEFLPRYVRVDLQAPEARGQYVLASASLPFGIVPPVKTEAGLAVDGGVVDNTPLYPLINFERCDRILVVHLSPAKSSADGDENYLRHWQRIDRLFKISRYEVPTGEFFTLKETGLRYSIPPVVIPLASPELWPVEIISVYPTRKLGGH